MSRTHDHPVESHRLNQNATTLCKLCSQTSFNILNVKQYSLLPTFNFHTNTGLFNSLWCQSYCDTEIIELNVKLSINYQNKSISMSYVVFQRPSISQFAFVICFLNLQANRGRNISVSNNIIGQ